MPRRPKAEGNDARAVSACGRLGVWPSRPMAVSAFGLFAVLLQRDRRPDEDRPPPAPIRAPRSPRTYHQTWRHMKPATPIAARGGPLLCRRAHLGRLRHGPDPYVHPRRRSHRDRRHSRSFQDLRARNPRLDRNRIHRHLHSHRRRIRRRRHLDLRDDRVRLLPHIEPRHSHLARRVSHDRIPPPRPRARANRQPPSPHSARLAPAPTRDRARLASATPAPLASRQVATNRRAASPRAHSPSRRHASYPAPHSDSTPPTSPPPLGGVALRVATLRSSP